MSLLNMLPIPATRGQGPEPGNVQKVEKLIKQRPVWALVVSVAMGVVVGWLVKRR